MKIELKPNTYKHTRHPHQDTHLKITLPQKLPLIIETNIQQLIQTPQTKQLMTPINAMMVLDQKITPQHTFPWYRYIDEKRELYQQTQKDYWAIMTYNAWQYFHINPNKSIYPYDTKKSYQK